jgi:hypothetical protein
MSETHIAHIVPVTNSVENEQVKQFIKKAEKIIKFEILTSVITQEQERELEKQENREEKMGLDLGIEYPKPKFLSRYINAGIYQIQDFFPNYNEDYSCETTVVTLFNCGTRKSETYELKISDTEFLQYLYFFNAVYIQPAD